MWAIAYYEATALFTLKPATATASGGKTLLVPTPYAIKMALLDVACRLEGQVVAESVWDAWLNDAVVALRPTDQVVINNTFAKVLRPRRNPTDPGSQDAGFFGRTIAYREYAYLDGKLGIAIEAPTERAADQVARWMLNINYLGRRGCFIQWISLPEPVKELPNGFLLVDGIVRAFTLDSVLTQLDDVGENLTFSRASIYTAEPIRLGVHRVLKHIALPYSLEASSRSYSHYVYHADE